MKAGRALAVRVHTAPGRRARRESGDGGGSGLYASECFRGSVVSQAEGACLGQPKLCGEHTEDELGCAGDHCIGVFGGAGGRETYGVQVRLATLPGLLAALLLGSASFTALGIGVVRYIKSPEAAPAVINFAILPLTFISGVWFHSNLSTLITDIAKVFPIRPLAHALQYAFNPLTTGSGIDAADLGTLAIWLLVGSFLSVRFLSQPAGGD